MYALSPLTLALAVSLLCCLYLAIEQPRGQRIKRIADGKPVDHHERSICSIKLIRGNHALNEIETTLQECSAILLRANHMNFAATSGHCVLDDHTEQWLRSRLSDDYNVLALPPQFRLEIACGNQANVRVLSSPTLDILIHKNYNPNDAMFDLAAMPLRGPLPGGWKPLDVADGYSEPLTKGTRCEVATFGPVKPDRDDEMATKPRQGPKQVIDHRLCHLADESEVFCVGRLEDEATKYDIRGGDSGGACICRFPRRLPHRDLHKVTGMISAVGIGGRILPAGAAMITPIFSAANMKFFDDVSKDFQ